MNTFNNSLGGIKRSVLARVGIVHKELSRNRVLLEVPLGNGIKVVAWWDDRVCMCAEGRGLEVGCWLTRF